MYLCTIRARRGPLDQVKSESWTPAKSEYEDDHQQHLKINQNEKIICK